MVELEFLLEVACLCLDLPMMGEVLANGGWQLLRNGGESLPAHGEDEGGELQAAAPGERPVEQREEDWRRKVSERAVTSQGGGGLGTSVMTRFQGEIRPGCGGSERDKVFAALVKAWVGNRLTASREKY